MVVNFRGKTLTRNDVERAMERFDREFRDNFRRWKTYSVKHNDRHYPERRKRNHRRSRIYGTC